VHHIQQLGSLLHLIDHHGGEAGLCRRQVDLPVPRGPNRKKLPAGGCRNRPSTAIFAAEMEFQSPFRSRLRGCGDWRGVVQASVQTVQKLWICF
jgi:hypothetical protein